jgi:hypothetical protein
MRAEVETRGGALGFREIQWKEAAVMAMRIRGPEDDVRARVAVGEADFETRADPRRLALLVRHGDAKLPNLLLKLADSPGALPAAATG